MARPADRMRLKDKIIDNISKAIKSIQELVYYQSKDPVYAGSTDSVILSNGDRPCHKLCENLDHALLHGLKQVTHGYWPVVKQLTHKGMVKEIALLTNVTTDLGRGRAWLYAALNECLLESYIRLLGTNEKLLKKYYAKEALVLDADRMNVILTLTSGLDFVTFQLEYDLPYLDLNAYPPRSRTDSELESDVQSSYPASRIHHSGSFRSEISASSPESTTRLPSDSDSASLASLDVQSNLDQIHHMRVSTISADSGYPGDVVFGNNAKQRSITPTETVVNSKSRSDTPADTVSISSLGSAGDQDRIQRLESIVSIGEEEDFTAQDSLEVIRVKNKRGTGNKSKKKKLASKKGNSDSKSVSEASEVSVKQSNGQVDSSDVGDGKLSSKTSKDSTDKVVKKDDEQSASRDSVKANSTVNGNDQCKSGDTDSLEDVMDAAFNRTSIPQYDSGVDICGLAASLEKSSSLSGEDVEKNTETSVESQNTTTEPRSALAQIESKIAELCSTSPSSSGARDHSHDSSVNGPAFNSHGGPPKGKVEPRDPKGNGNIDTLGTSNGRPSTRDSSGRIETLKTMPLSSSAPNFSKHGHHGADHNRNDSTHHRQKDRDIKVDESSADQSKHINNDSSKQIVDRHISTNSEKETTTKHVNKTERTSPEVEDDFDFYSRSWEKDMPHSQSDSKLARAAGETHLQDYVDYILQSPDSPPVAEEKHEPHEDKGTDLSFSLDNNMKLQVMLDIFKHEDETFLKMFVTRESHTEGEAGVMFVLISDQCLYLLQYKRSTKKFVLHSSARLVDLIFISTGLNDQTINIESREKNKQKQRLWLTPGHQALTQAILACLTEAVKTANENIMSVRSRFSVGSEVPLQKIALRKYISKELHCEPQDVTINDYSLVFWEDPSSHKDPSHNAAYKEGTLLLRMQDPLKGYVWKPVYVVLRNSMLCVSNNKSDPRPHSSLGLGGDQCIGCRITPQADREYCLELVTAQDASWFLSAATETEISEWRHALCLAVSQGTVENHTLTSCVPCCAVLACDLLFLCHEDLHTKFYRTLGRAKIEDITGLLVDEEDKTYCVIEFESQDAGVSSDQWVFYFSSPQDMDRHVNAVSAAWMQTYQIDLPVMPLDNAALQRHCRSHAQLLRQQLTLR